MSSPEPVTKWSVLQERLAAAKQEVELLQHRLEALENTPCNLSCSYCGTLFETEADFAKHFILTYGKEFLNLGECPQNPKTPTQYL